MIEPSERVYILLNESFFKVKLGSSIFLFSNLIIRYKKLKDRTYLYIKVVLPTPKLPNVITI